MTQTITNLYELYKKRHTELLDIAQRQSDLVQTLKIDTVQGEGTKHGEVMSGIINRLRTDKLRVLVIGRFSAGKTTFINALFGQAILPASPTPTTGVLCEVKFANESNKKATLYPKKGMGKNGNDAPFDIKMSNLQEELKKYIKIDNDNSQFISPYQKLELHWPLPMLQHGVELIDSVGLDDPDSRDVITQDFAKSVDVILYCLKSQDAYSSKDKQTLSMLNSLGYESIFFVITYYDHILESVAMGQITEDEFRLNMSRNLTQYTELKEKGIQYVNSKSALLGKIQHNEEMVVSSGIYKVETALENFLVEEKGRAKLLTTLRTLRSTNRAVRQIIPARRSMWQASTQELERRYKEAEQPLKNLEIKQQSMIDSLNLNINDIARDAYDMADGFFMSLPDKIVQWMNKCEITAGVFPPTKGSLEPVVNEVVEYIKAHIEEETANWNHNELAPMIESRMETIHSKLEESARAFIKQADEIRVHISVGDKINNETIAEQENPSMLGRLVAGGYGLITGDIFTAGLGSIMGMKAMLRTIVHQIIAGISVGIISLFTPVGWGMIITAGITAIITGGFHNILSLKKGIKEKVSKNFSEEISKNQKELSKNIENKVREELNKMKTALDSALDAEISSIRGEVESILEERKKANFNVEREIKTLNILEKDNIALEENIDRLIFEAGLNIK